MDILSTWPGRIAAFLLAFPLVMLVLPFLIAALRQRLAWDKRDAVDTRMDLDPSGSGARRLSGP